ncbi:creatininase family protein [Duganella violaceipulchra]|uniref:Creatininase family protein n=1 Tax=Duganella violaceipulchra TaxID=2849652 RepID=A0AA41L4S0_9BURK|nr:creatininase family protein [Duganella violaceicalia]MBV6323274.1 creatininase family protein [Duganella violaceicalia]MCP2007776.1 creatinine amidohydrolase/Fe(II)-dependent formamide hydrolase-like protein [Duganella violaceicalia]
MLTGAGHCAGLLVAAASLLTLPVRAATSAERGEGVGRAGQGGASVMLEELTSTELRSRIEHGATTILIPIGGVEQSGPYIALGKHNVRAGIIAAMIAQKLGNTMVAPVVSYVPEGAVTPPAGHMRFSGTISIPPAAFEAVLEGAAASFRQHGFRDIIFIGDHGGYQQNEVSVAQKLNRAWGKSDPARAYALLDYYDVTQTAFIDDLKKQGYSSAEIGLHAGLSDASLMLATAPSMVRIEAMSHGPKPGVADGVRGDATRASAELGRLGVQRQVEASVSAIKTILQERHH